MLEVKQHSDRERMMIGIDGGGTKTEFVLFSESGRIEESFILEGSNPNVSGMEKTFSVLQKGIARIMRNSSQIVGIFAGISGCAAKKNSQAVTEFLQKNYPDTKIQCDTDILNVLGNIPNVTNCITAISGTGSVVYAYENGKLNRLGGWGYLLDPEGSGYGLGRDAMRAVLAENDGIGKATLLTELVETQLGSSVWEQIDRIYAENSRYIASFAPLVFDAAYQGDSVANEILEHHMKHMAFLINQAVRQYDCGDTVLMAGGLLKHKEIVLKHITQHLEKPMNIIVPTRPQVYGACVQCCKLCGIDTKAIEQNFETEYKKRMRK